MATKARKVAIVTGAANGIGKGICERLSAEGWRVAAADVEEKALARMTAGTAALKITTDVTEEAQIIELVATVRKKFRRIDAIVSNAGISEFASLEESSLGDWNRVLATNLTPAFLLAKYAERDLRNAKGGMVLIASTRARMSEPDTHAYAASKGGLVALGHSLAISLGPEVRVNVVSPGWIDVSGEKLSKADHAQHPVGRVGKVEDIAAAVSFLLADETGFITGIELVADGGMTRKMIYRE